ncbi:MAG: hypothetical protein IJC77_05610 [Bacteroidaceae bacterium]|nr:hypothetical protein [Bacteroidaceae bacterium]
MKNKISFVIGLLVVLTMSLCLLVRYASHSTNEAVRRRAVMAYYHTIGRSAEKHEAARYLLDNMPYHYGVTVRDSKAVRCWARETTETLRGLLDEYGLYQIPGDTIRALRDERRADSLVSEASKQSSVLYYPIYDATGIFFGGIKEELRDIDLRST